jgi:hypothetical protein
MLPANISSTVAWILRIYISSIAVGFWTILISGFGAEDPIFRNVEPPLTDTNLFTWEMFTNPEVVTSLMTKLF